MKKKTIFYALTAAMLLGSLSSCDKNNDNNNNDIVNPDVDPNNNIEPHNPVINFADDEKSRKVYNEFKKYFPELTFEDFQMTGSKLYSRNEIYFEYESSNIRLDMDGAFLYENIRYADREFNAIYLNGEWVITGEYKYINNVKLTIFSIYLENNSYISKTEYTYDENGKEVTKVFSEYINNKWIKTKEYNPIRDNMIGCTLSIDLNDDGTYKTKKEYEYDTNGYQITVISSDYINNDWLLKYKNEYTNDEAGKILTYASSEYINNEWILKSQDKVINGNMHSIYHLSTNEAGEFITKNEYTYDENGNMLTSVESKYINNEWVKSSKTEYTYDENGNKTGTKTEKYDYNEIISKSEYTYNESGKLSYSITTNYKNNQCDRSNEMTYDEAGNILSISDIYYKNNEYDYKNTSFLVEGTTKTSIRYKYLNKEWIKTHEETLFNSNQSKIIYKLDLNEDGTFKSKTEYTYDNEGNALVSTEYKYINNEWIKTLEYSYVRKEELYRLYLNEDNTFKTKMEREYNSDTDKTLCIYSNYQNGEWVLSSKDEETYDKALNIKTSISLKCVNDEWVYGDNKVESIYDENHNFVRFITYEYINDEWIVNQDAIRINNQFKNLCILHKMSTGELEHEEYSYDEYGNTLTRTILKYIDKKWVMTQDYVYIHNTQKPLCRYIYSNDEYYSKTEYTYGYIGDLLSQTATTYKYKNDKWLKVEEKYIVEANNNDSTKVEFSYDSNDCLITEIVYKNNNGNWVYSEKCAYTYDDNKIILEEMSRNNNGEWDLYSKKEYTYTNNKTVATTSYKNNDAWDLFRKTESTYDLSGNCIIEITSKYENNAWCYYTKKENTYNADGNCIIEINSFYRDDKWEYGYKLENTYDSNGNLLVYIVSYYENDTWSHDQKIEYTYNQRGMKTSYSVYRYLNNEWILTDSFKFIDLKPINIYYLNIENGVIKGKFEAVKYSSYGYPTTTIYSKYENNEWIYVSKTECVYDDNGNMTSYGEYEYIDGEWVSLF